MAIINLRLYAIDGFQFPGFHDSKSFDGITWKSKFLTEFRPHRSKIWNVWAEYIDAFKDNMTTSKTFFSKFTPRQLFVQK